MFLWLFWYDKTSQELKMLCHVTLYWRGAVVLSCIFSIYPFLLSFRFTCRHELFRTRPTLTLYKPRGYDEVCLNQTCPKFELCFCLALLTPCITFPDRFLITFLILNNLFCWLVTTTEFQLFNHPSQILNLSQTKHSKHKMNFNQFNSV